MISCRLCGKEVNTIVYHGKIRDGKVGNYTKVEMDIYQCSSCGVMFHEDCEDTEALYETDEYRNKMGEDAEKSLFDSIHDVENFEKFRYTGMDSFRGKVVADIGCGGGSFLDFIGNVASEIIAIEPTQRYHEALEKKGYHAYSYAKNALSDYEGKVDVIVSFDVIEHVSNPSDFIADAKRLLKIGGKAIIGTPTDAPVMRKLLGDKYSSFLFSTQHPWVLNEESFNYIAKENDIITYELAYFQRYGLNNFFNWIQSGEPKGKEQYEFATEPLNRAWIAELERLKLSDYIVFKFVK